MDAERSFFFCRTSLRLTVGLYTADMERRDFLNAPRVRSWLWALSMRELARARALSRNVVRARGASLAAHWIIFFMGLCPKTLKMSGTSGKIISMK